MCVRVVCSSRCIQMLGEVGHPQSLIRPSAGHPSVRIGLPAQVRLRRAALSICGHNRAKCADPIKWVYYNGICVHNRTKYALTQSGGPIGLEMVWPQFGPPMLPSVVMASIWTTNNALRTQPFALEKIETQSRLCERSKLTPYSRVLD